MRRLSNRRSVNSPDRPRHYRSISPPVRRDLHHSPPRLAHPLSPQQRHPPLTNPVNARSARLQERPKSQMDKKQNTHEHRRRHQTSREDKPKANSPARERSRRPVEAKSPNEDCSDLVNTQTKDKHTGKRSEDTVSIKEKARHSQHQEDITLVQGAPTSRPDSKSGRKSAQQQDNAKTSLKKRKSGKRKHSPRYVLAGLTPLILSVVFYVS